ncbi:MAG: hypothetical protein ACRD2A_03850, partial [Vicinamibacterales bacterium]
MEERTTPRLRVGYGKFGRTLGLSPKAWGPVGGDNEPYYLLRQLALATPDVEWRLVGRNTGEDPVSVGLPSNVTQPWTPELQATVPFVGEDAEGYKVPRMWQGVRPKTPETIAEVVERTTALTSHMFEDLDHAVLWLGQHGTSQLPIPNTKD